MHGVEMLTLLWQYSHFVVAFSNFLQTGLRTRVKLWINWGTSTLVSVQNGVVHYVGVLFSRKWLQHCVQYCQDCVLYTYMCMSIAMLGCTYRQRKQIEVMLCRVKHSGKFFILLYTCLPHVLNITGWLGRSKNEVRLLFHHCSQETALPLSFSLLALNSYLAKHISFVPRQSHALQDFHCFTVYFEQRCLHVAVAVWDCCNKETAEL